MVELAQAARISLPICLADVTVPVQLAAIVRRKAFSWVTVDEVAQATKTGLLTCLNVVAAPAQLARTLLPMDLAQATEAVQAAVIVWLYVVPPLAGSKNVSTNNVLLDVWLTSNRLVYLLRYW